MLAKLTAAAWTKRGGIVLPVVGAGSVAGCVASGDYFAVPARAGRVIVPGRTLGCALGAVRCALMKQKDGVRTVRRVFARTPLQKKLTTRSCDPSDDTPAVLPKRVPRRNEQSVRARCNGDNTCRPWSQPPPLTANGECLGKDDQGAQRRFGAACRKCRRHARTCPLRTTQREAEEGMRDGSASVYARRRDWGLFRVSEQTAVCNERWSRPLACRVHDATVAVGLT